MEEQVDILAGRLDGVMREVAATQRATLAQRSVLAQVRMRQPVRRSAFARIASGLPRLRFVIPTLAVAGAVALWVGRGNFLGNQAPLSFAVGENTAGTAGDHFEAARNDIIPLRFSDGSRVTLNGGARVHVAELDNRGATLRVETGRAEVDVHHERNTRWRLRAGTFEVMVTGTKFSIEWENAREALTVVMTEGTVEVRGPGVAQDSPVVVSAGQRFHATAREARWTLAAASAPVAAAVAVAVPSESEADQAADPMPAAPTEAPAEATTPSARAAGASTTRATTWQAMARAGRYQEALKMVERSGFDRACRRLGSEDLIQLGDAARFARNPARAEAAYRAARKRFPASDRPAFALGLVAFEQRRDFKAAAHWFDLYVQKYPNGPLANEAAGREMESWHRAGDVTRARRAARAYLDQAPSGPYAPLARQISAP